MKKNLILLGVLGAAVIAFAFTTSTKKNDNTATAGHKVTICHYPPGNPGNVQEITISKNAWCAHEKHHGDFIKRDCEPCPCLNEGNDD